MLTIRVQRTAESGIIYSRLSFFDYLNSKQSDLQDVSQSQALAARSPKNQDKHAGAELKKDQQSTAKAIDLLVY